jgi:ADP-ribose pyrophosphatase YjhB (NUDIX family)
MTTIQYSSGSLYLSNYEPVTSVGIICIKLDSAIYDIFIKNISKISYYNLNNIMLHNIHLYDKYNDMIQFMLVKRRHSLNYIEFIRGKYDIYDTSKLNNMFSLMSREEVDDIKNKDFNTLWNNLWMKNAHKKKYLAELNLSRDKFNQLKNNGFFNNMISEYKMTEWEIPKGRKNSNEKNIECAIREFKEETNINEIDHIILNCLDPIHDNFTGTNGLNYRHIFYTSLLCNNDINININNNEIDMAKWCKWSELNDIIRPYNNNKINILTSIFLFIINVCEQ